MSLKLEHNYFTVNDMYLSRPVHYSNYLDRIGFELKLKSRLYLTWLYIEEKKKKKRPTRHYGLL